jgi:hypothetical protein
MWLEPFPGSVFWDDDFFTVDLPGLSFSLCASENSRLLKDAEDEVDENFGREDEWDVGGLKLLGLEGILEVEFMIEKY